MRNWILPAGLLLVGLGLVGLLAAAFWPTYSFTQDFVLVYPSETVVERTWETRALGPAWVIIFPSLALVALGAIALWSTLAARSGTQS